MDKLKEILLSGNQLFEDSEKKYKENKQENMVKSHLNYINFIKKEFNKITNMVEIEAMPDFQRGCIYFGTGTLYYSQEFLKHDTEDMVNIVLNHIIHFTGCLYIINSSQVRLSYIMQALSIIYGEPLSYLEGKSIYLKNNIQFKHIIFDIKSNYQNFILNNRGLMSFIKGGLFNNDNTKYIIYRIILGENVILKNMELNILNNKIAGILEQVSCDKQYYTLIS